MAVVESTPHHIPPGVVVAGFTDSEADVRGVVVGVVVGVVAAAAVVVAGVVVRGDVVGGDVVGVLAERAETEPDTVETVARDVVTERSADACPDPVPDVQDTADRTSAVHAAAVLSRRPRCRG